MNHKFLYHRKCRITERYTNYIETAYILNHELVPALSEEYKRKVARINRRLHQIGLEGDL